MFLTALPSTAAEDPVKAAAKLQIECVIRGGLFAGAYQRHNMHQTREEVSSIIYDALQTSQQNTMGYTLKPGPARAWASKMLTFVFSRPRLDAMTSASELSNGFVQACINNPETMATPAIVDWEASRGNR